MKLLSFPLPTGASMTAWLHTANPELTDPLCARRPAVILCPGGGYARVSGREEDPVAAEYFAMGAQVFVLTYSVGEGAADKRPLEELARTMLMVRTHAEEWLVDPEKVVVTGFSAGGHLACSLGVHWEDPEILARLGIEDAAILRPNGMILCYPVITMIDGLTHKGTKKHIMAHTAESQDYWSLETQVNGNTPPVFLWHTMTDAGVPVENSLLLISALRRHGVGCEAHLFPEGVHGMSLCNVEVGTPDAQLAQWLTLCRNWLNRYFGPISLV